MLFMCAHGLACKETKFKLKHWESRRNKAESKADKEENRAQGKDRSCGKKHHNIMK